MKQDYKSVSMCVVFAFDYMPYVLYMNCEYGVFEFWKFVMECQFEITKSKMTTNSAFLLSNF